MSSPRYKLTYFQSRGRAEVARVLFHYANVDFEDCRLKDPESWPNLKPETPFGQIPILAVDGDVICQSHAICSYLARTFGLAGKSDWDQAKVFMIVGCVQDFIRPIESLFGVTDEQHKAGVLQKYDEEQMPTAMANFEKFLAANKSGFFVGEEMTWADIAFAIDLMWFKAVGAKPVAWDKYPRCKTLVDRVNTEPRIAAYIAHRPVTQY